MTIPSGFIEACERERLHLSGVIQPHGALVVADAEHKVTHASRNLAQWLGMPAERLLGRRLPPGLAAPLGALGTAPGERVVRNAVVGIEGDAALFASRGLQGEVILELVPSLAVPREPDNVRQTGSVASLRDATALADARHALVDSLRQASGFDRVLFYQFLPDGDGEVLAEACGDAAQGSYLGLRFPASDIPQVARNLYVLNPWRTIPDAQAASVEVVSRYARAPDLTYADLRSVSPVHRAYMANMGVASAVSFPLVAGGALTALISLHAYSPRRLSPLRLQALADEVKAFELAQREFHTRQRMTLVDTLERRYAAKRRHLLELGSLEAAWPEISHWLMAEFEADGVMLDNGIELFRQGVTLEPEALTAVTEWCDGAGTTTRQSECLSRDCAEMPLSEVAGVLSMVAPLADGRRLRLYVCRVEEVQEVAWGGNPSKPEEDVSAAYPIAPRRSFERWVEQRMGHARPWPESSHLKLLKLRTLVSAMGQ